MQVCLLWRSRPCGQTQAVTRHAALRFAAHGRACMRALLPRSGQHAGAVRLSRSSLRCTVPEGRQITRPRTPPSALAFAKLGAQTEFARRRKRRTLPCPVLLGGAHGPPLGSAHRRWRGRWCSTRCDSETEHVESSKCSVVQADAGWPAGSPCATLSTATQRGESAACGRPARTIYAWPRERPCGATAAAPRSEERKGPVAKRRAAQSEA
jgi:hypothetical protein